MKSHVEWSEGKSILGRGYCRKKDTEGLRVFEAGLLLAFWPGLLEDPAYSPITLYTVCIASVPSTP